MLQINDLQVRYGDFIAVDSCSLQIDPGRILALIGTNGAGKTSLLNTAAGLIRPVSGQVYFNSEEITGLRADEVIGRGLCLVPQGGRCFSRMSVQDNLLVGSYPKAARARAKDSLEKVYSLFPDLRDRRSAPAGSLSGGQRQMVAIGRALMSRPKCLMFDEISLGLAPVIIRDLYECIRRINREDGTTIVLVEQDTGRALEIADSFAVMLKGSVTMTGSAADPDFEKIKTAYFGM
ncbi:MAG: ABC transporter ATP-binding protein [Eubacteriales bacterium]|nr:ABC transporter ATP-binding protein [Eubacteriales bacterium]